MTTTAPPAAAAAVTSEDAKLVVAYKEDVIEKLKPFLELTKGFAGPNVVELVCFLTLSSLKQCDNA